jgi:predicted DNA-binding transcriptional regulator AlpA
MSEIDLDALVERVAAAVVERLRSESTHYEYMTPRQVSELTGFAQVTLEKWRKEGTGPQWARCGTRAVRYARRDVIAWLAGRRGER